MEGGSKQKALGPGVCTWADWERLLLQMRQSPVKLNLPTSSKGQRRREAQEGAKTQVPLWPSHHTRSPNSGWQRLSGQAFFSDNPLPSLSFTDGSTHPGLEVIRFLFIFCFVSIFFKVGIPTICGVCFQGRPTLGSCGQMLFCALLSGAGSPYTAALSRWPRMEAIPAMTSTMVGPGNPVSIRLQPERPQTSPPAPHLESVFKGV